MEKKIKVFLFFGIILVASFLRLWMLGEVPLSPDWDEAALGYNAYSIMETGRDEYGEFMPLILRSFDDYKPGLYAYLVVPFIKFLGLNLVAVRLPSVIFGIFTVLAAFLVVKRLFGSDHLALLSSFLLAISPWHIQFSRIAFEANVGLALNIFTVFFFLKGLRNPLFFLYSFVLASSNIYMYQGEKVFTPLLLLALLIIYRKDVAHLGKKWLFVSCLIAFIITIPFVLSTFTNQHVLLRAKGVSVFSDQTEFLKRNASKVFFDKSSSDVLGLIVDNRRFEYLKAVIAGYISHFDLNWLFITGDLPRHHAPYMGLMYLFELPFLLIGIYRLLFGHYDKKAKLVIFSIFLLAPIPASITSGVPHAIRTLNFLPTFQIFTAIGIITVFLHLSSIKYLVLSIKLRYVLFFLFMLLFVFNFSYYLNQYFVQLNYYTSKEWQYGYKEAVAFVKPLMNKYDSIVVSNKEPLDQSYMFFLFYLQYDPKLYQQSGGTVSGGFAETHKGFSNFTFRPIEWGKEKKENVLFVGRPGDFPEEAHALKKIFYLNGEEAIRIVEG